MLCNRQSIWSQAPRDGEHPQFSHPTSRVAQKGTSRGLLWTLCEHEVDTNDQAPDAPEARLPYAHDRVLSCTCTSVIMMVGALAEYSHPSADSRIKMNSPCGLLVLTSGSLTGWHYSARTTQQGDTPCRTNRLRKRLCSSRHCLAGSRLTLLLAISGTAVTVAGRADTLTVTSAGDSGPGSRRYARP